MGFDVGRVWWRWGLVWEGFGVGGVWCRWDLDISGILGFDI